MRWIALFAIILMTGCSPTIHAAGERGGFVHTGGAMNQAAFDLAENHCRKFGRHATFTQAVDYSTGQAPFQCVP